MICSAATTITFPYSAVLNTTAETDDPATLDTDCGSGNSYNAVWFKFTPTFTGQYNFDVIDDLDEAVLTIFTGNCGALVFSGNCGYGAGNIFTLTASTDYFILITSFDPGGIAALTFNLSYPTPAGDFCAVLSCDNNPYSGIYEMIRDKTNDTLYLSITTTSVGVPPTFVLIDKKIP